FLDGPDESGTFLPGEASLAEGIIPQSVPITVTQIGKIWGNAPQGNLAGEVYLRLRLIDALSIRGGVRLNQFALSTEQSLGLSQSQTFYNYDRTWFVGLQLHLSSD
ncbi:MAG: hypothetical protein AAFQ68_27875, partial [Bacteroidota bacterium]